MVRVTAILAGIFLAAYAVVHLGYARLEKELLTRSCCSITELPVSGDDDQKSPGAEQDTSEGRVQERQPALTDTEDAQTVDYEHPDFQVIRLMPSI